MSSHAYGASGVELARRPGPGNAPADGQLVLGCDFVAGEARVSFTGELDMSSAGQAFWYVQDVIDRYRAAVVLDVTHLSFCDARGLAALLRMSRYAEQACTSLRLMSPSRQLLQILRITGLGDTLRVTKGPARPAIGRGSMCGYEQTSRTSARRARPRHA